MLTKKYLKEILLILKVGPHLFFFFFFFFFYNNNET